MSAIPDMEASASSLAWCLPAGCHASVDDGNGVNLRDCKPVPINTFV